MSKMLRLCVTMLNSEPLPPWNHSNWPLSLHDHRGGELLMIALSRNRCRFLTETEYVQNVETK